jgi:hypothetical protein
VKLTIEIDVHDSWNDDCRMDQILKQATESAEGAISRGLAIDGRGAHGNTSPTFARIIGEPQVEIILVTKEAKR